MFGLLVFNGRNRPGRPIIKQLSNGKLIRQKRRYVAAEAVKAREGLSNGAKDLATLASVLAYRAKVEGVAAGKTESQVAEGIAADRAVATKAGGADDGELQSCADLAAAE